MFYFYAHFANYQSYMAGINIRVGLSSRLHLSLPNAALLVGAVIFKLTRRQEGGIGETGIIRGRLKRRRLKRWVWKDLFRFYPNLRNIRIPQCHLPLHCWTKRSWNTFVLIGLFTNFLYISRREERVNEPKKTGTRSTWGLSAANT